jgi:hypothetical protein
MTQHNTEDSTAAVMALIETAAPQDPAAQDFLRRRVDACIQLTEQGDSTTLVKLVSTLPKVEQAAVPSTEDEDTVVL